MLSVCIWSLYKRFRNTATSLVSNTELTLTGLSSEHDSETTNIMLLVFPVSLKPQQKAKHVDLTIDDTMGTTIIVETEYVPEQKTLCGKVGTMLWNLLFHYNKLFLSFLYMFTAISTQAITLVIANNRVPYGERHPPLPDIVLDNISMIPWAFPLTEKIMVALFIILLIICVFHKHRFIVIRRILVLTGSVYFLRCVTMFVTSLPAAGTHIRCQSKVNYTFWPMAQRVSGIFSNFGMSTDATVPCGDNIYSGHAAILTLSSFFIREYTPSRLFLLHIATWICNIIGMFLILVGHEHYTVDVILSFYIVPQLFNSYHHIAYSKSSYQTEKNWVGIWRPLFAFFESKGDGAVTNEYEWPLPGLPSVGDIGTIGTKRIV